MQSPYCALVIKYFWLFGLDEKGSEFYGKSSQLNYCGAHNILTWHWYVIQGLLGRCHFIELLYVFPPKLQSRGRDKTTLTRLNAVIPWKAADEDHRAASQTCPILSLGLPEEAEQRARSDMHNRALGELAAAPWTSAPGA